MREKREVEKDLARVLEGIRKELKGKGALKDQILNDSRKITSLSKKAIMLVHRREFKGAEECLKEAEGILTSARKVWRGSSELLGGGAVSAAAEEFAEAQIMLHLERDGVLVGVREVGVSPSSYVMGMADVVGELRRKILDAMRMGQSEAAEGSFKLMESIYSGLALLNEEVFSVLPGLRRKCDVARHLVEISRADVVTELRARSLENSLKQVEERVGRPRSGDG